MRVLKKKPQEGVQWLLEDAVRQEDAFDTYFVVGSLIISMASTGPARKLSNFLLFTHRIAIPRPLSHTDSSTGPLPGTSTVP